MEQVETSQVDRNFDNGLMDHDIICGNIHYAVQKAKCGNTTGIDEVPIEVLKSDTVLQFLLIVCFNSVLSMV